MIWQAIPDIYSLIRSRFVWMGSGNHITGRRRRKPGISIDTRQGLSYNLSIILGGEVELNHV